VRNTAGVIVVMTLVLYPYVYMLARVAFLGQGQSTFEAARSLGLSPWQAFLRVSLPMARPGIIAGLSLALMEALADFGAVAVFNYDTFTTAIYKAWFGFFDLNSAAQLASLLLGVVLLALVAERHFRARARFAETGRGGRARRFELRAAGRGVSNCVAGGPWPPAVMPDWCLCWPSRHPSCSCWCGPGRASATWMRATGACWATPSYSVSARPW
jgi:iron(III) transport system permease protein